MIRILECPECEKEKCHSILTINDQEELECECGHVFANPPAPLKRRT